MFLTDTQPHGASPRLFISSSLDRTPLEATKYCDTTLKQAVAKIISVISRQLDGFFEDARYDWMARQPPVAGSDGEEEPSGFLLDMVNYLSLSMDNQLAGLSSSNRNEVYRGALRHCATSLMVSAAFHDQGSLAGPLPLD